ncbi:hypothetical protein [Streptomyces sp. NPDC002619]|uniref:hypothetical protein n=1 Tax=Streptomyces sp. NPDC002619 TaxID=3364655 RepID=UPI0036AC750D
MTARPAPGETLQRRPSALPTGAASAVRRDQPTEAEQVVLDRRDLRAGEAGFGGSGAGGPDAVPVMRPGPSLPEELIGFPVPRPLSPRRSLMAYLGGFRATRAAAIGSRMPIPWRSSTEAFAQILRQRGVEPDAVRNVETAWDAFVEFLQIEIEGIEGAENDGDGFIAEWGRWGWNGDQPALSFARLLAVTDAGECEDSHGQPEYWKVELQLIFAENPAWNDLDGIGFHDTGFDYDEIGEPRIAALLEMRRFIESYPQLAAMWRAGSIRSNLTFEQAG